MATTRLEWTDRAACRHGDATLFYAVESAERKEDRLLREQRAKQLCAGCSVRGECLDAALERHESYGIWGGLNELERRALLRSIG